MRHDLLEINNLLINNNNTEVTLRLLNKPDADKLYQYLHSLSAESRSRFGPHPFDHETIKAICLSPATNIVRYVAETGGKIIAYMLIQNGWIEADHQRYAERNIFFDEAVTATYAPSVADDFQNCGLGSKIFSVILNDLQDAGYKFIVLWGGVQATNTRAIHFYEKHGFQYTGSFWHDGKDNHDLVKKI